MDSYCVYAYVFDNGMTYVGLTRQDPKRRDEQHRSAKRTRRTAVQLYARSQNLPVPDMFVLYTELSKTEAQQTEYLLTQAVDLKFRLNKAPTGVGIGSTGKPEGLAMTPEERVKRRIERRSANKERIAEYQADYYRANRERILAYHARYRKDHAERIAKYEATYRKTHKCRTSNYRKAHREQMAKAEAAYHAAYRKRKKLENE